MRRCYIVDLKDEDVLIKSTNQEVRFTLSMDQPAAHDTTSTLTHLSSLLEEEYHSHIATLGLLMQAQESADVWKRTAEYLSHRLDIAKSEVLWLQAQLENYRTEVRRLNLIITNSVRPCVAVE